VRSSLENLGSVAIGWLSGGRVLCSSVHQLCLGRDQMLTASKAIGYVLRVGPTSIDMYCVCLSRRLRNLLQLYGAEGKNLDSLSIRFSKSPLLHAFAELVTEAQTFLAVFSHRLAPSSAKAEMLDVNVVFAVAI
jgi:hypothetical protein